MSNDDFIHYILLPELATKFYMEKDDITYREASLKLYDNEFPTLHRLCLIAVRKTGQYKNLIRRMEKIGCVTAIKKVYF